MEVGGGKALEAVQKATDAVRDRSTLSWAQLPETPLEKQVDSSAESFAELTLAESAALEGESLRSAEA